MLVKCHDDGMGVYLTEMVKACWRRGTVDEWRDGCCEITQHVEDEAVTHSDTRRMAVHTIVTTTTPDTTTVAVSRARIWSPRQHHCYYLGRPQALVWLGYTDTPRLERYLLPWFDACRFTASSWGSTLTICIMTAYVDAVHNRR